MQGALRRAKNNKSTGSEQESTMPQKCHAVRHLVKWTPKAFGGNDLRSSVLETCHALRHKSATLWTCFVETGAFAVIRPVFVHLGTYA